MEIKKEVLDSMVNVGNSDYARENANINAATPAGMMQKFGSMVGRTYNHDYLMSDKVREAVDTNHIWPHDADYGPTKSLTCLQHPLDRIWKYGFDANDGSARPPKRIESAAMLAAITMQNVQNEMHRKLCL